MLSLVEHGKGFITSGPGFIVGTLYILRGDSLTGYNFPKILYSFL